MIMTAVKEKICSKCGKTKEVNNFYKKGRGYTSWCKDCMKELSKQRVLDGRDRQSKIKYELKNGHHRNNLIKKTAPIKVKIPVTEQHKMVKEMYRNMVKRSKFGNLEMTVSFEEIEKMVNDFCVNNYHVITLKKHPFKPSIDRIEPSKGYIQSNIKICWLIENYCKNTFTDDDVIEFCKRKLNLYE